MLVIRNNLDIIIIILEIPVPTDLHQNGVENADIVCLLEEMVCSRYSQHYAPNAKQHDIAVVKAVMRLGILLKYAAIKYLSIKYRSRYGDSCYKGIESGNSLVI